MSVRGAEGAGAAGSELAERRAAVGQRVHFEALVAVGEAAGGGFEAESVDVSPDGMRLRTAYLPDVGDKLVCRFDGMGAEVVAEGEVIWRNPEARGGEFGLRFTGLDAEGEATVRAMCASLAGDAKAPALEAPAVPRGARVRLHIEGLGSPMKARVREAAAKEVEVGSNLEFLKVGRSLELEDVEYGKRREARIEHVKVDVDPATNVPQLVVSLRYEASAEAAGKAPEPSAVASPSRASAAGVVDPETRSPKRPGARSSTAPATRRTLESTSSESRDQGRKSVAGAASGLSDDEAKAASEGEAGEEREGVGERAARAGRAVADSIGPALSGMSSRARGAMSSVVAAIQRRRTERAETLRQNAPRRMTAPPPGGALKADGRRLIREDGAEEAEDETTERAPRTNRRAAALGGALGLAAVLALFGASRYLGARTAVPSGTSADASLTAAPAQGALPAAAAASPSGAAALGTPMTNVPLFGATPLSTTEPVPPPPSPQASAVALAGTPPSPDGAGAASGDSDDEPSLADKSGPGLKEWGQGSVAHPVVLKIKMDGPIERITGASGAMGFTLSIPDRRSLSTSHDFARKDKRLALVNVVNTSHGAEVTVQFKDGVPAYRAKAKGDRLEIALGTEGHKKVAKKKKVDDKAKPKAARKKAHR
jgi:hypothetical protein